MLDAFVAFEPERVLDFLRVGCDLPNEGPAYVVNFTKHPRPDVGKRCRRYIEYRSETGWFKSVGGINEADREGFFNFYGIAYYAHKSGMANPGHDGPEPVVGAVDGPMFRIGYMASALGALRNVLTLCVLANKNLNTYSSI